MGPIGGKSRSFELGPNVPRTSTLADSQQSSALRNKTLQLPPRPRANHIIWTQSRSARLSGTSEPFPGNAPGSGTTSPPYLIQVEKPRQSRERKQFCQRLSTENPAPTEPAS